MDDIMNKVALALASRTSSDPDGIIAETRFSELALDSLDVAELVMDLEDAFSVTIDISQIDGTVGDLVRVIREAAE
ncbi:MAG: phosphopantetheine-binding protein [Eubacteriales bacterium]|nr:phosphopantetheine-binding protein [Eubacteriales bacterium]